MTEPAAKEARIVSLTINGVADRMPHVSTEYNGGQFGVRGIRVMFRPDHRYGAMLHVELTPNYDAVTGRPMREHARYYDDLPAVVRDVPVPPLLLQTGTPQALRMWIRREVLYVLEHELDEWLSCDGERVTEPHPPVKTWVLK